MSGGKKVLLIAGLGLAAVTLMIGSCGGLIFYGFSSSDQAAGPVIEEVFRSFAENETATAYDSLTSAAFRESVSLEQFEGLAAVFNENLGSLQSKSMSSFNWKSNNGESRMEVVYAAQFERAEGTINATLLKEPGGWRLLSVTVESPALMEITSASTCPMCGAKNEFSANFCAACGARLSADDTPPTGAANEDAAEPSGVGE